MGKYFKTRSILLAILLCTFSNGIAQEIPVQDLPTPVNRQAKFSGSFYPAQRSTLESQLRTLFSQALPIEATGTVQTLIVPHAGYEYCGVVAASGYKCIPTDAHYDNIFIIATSHREQFEGVSVYSVGNYITPLGEARVNREIAQSLMDGNPNIIFNPRAHNREHSIEVQIPYLQYHLKELPPIVPLVMGSSSISGARDLATALLPWFTPENLFIISSEFSQYTSFEDAKQVDKLTGEAILKKDPEIFYKSLVTCSKKATPNLSTPSYGWSSIMTMLYMANRVENLELSPVLYRNSGDSKVGDKQRVVGYWAITGSKKQAKEQTLTLNDAEKQQLLEISHSALEFYINTGELPALDPGILSPAMKKPSGVMVSLYMGGRLRGSMANFSSSDPLYAVVEGMTIAAAIHDQRFAPVEEPELKYLEIELSILTPLRKIGSIDEFELGKHGIYMKKGEQSGTFLPHIAHENGWSTEELLGHCASDKAGIGWDGWKEAELFVYEAIIFGEKKEN
jgi:MEMO1 family protein